MNYYIGADLGTSSLKLLLLDEKKKIVKSIKRDYPIFYPNPGWSEQNPADWWNAFVYGVKELVSDIDSKSVRGISVAGQMHGLVILDEEDQVIRPAILWNDGRCEKETAYLNDNIGRENLSEWTANIAFAGFTAPKILWLQNQEYHNFKRICKIMLPKDYLNYRLTGVHATDYSDASGTLLLDVKHKCWSDRMLKICNITEQQMPRLYESFAPIGKVLPEISKLFGFRDDVIVAAGAGDNAGAAIGTRTVGDGRCNISLGTSGTIFVSTHKFSVDSNSALHSFCHADGGYHLMGCMLSAASCNKWFCEEILKTENYREEQSHIDDSMLGNNGVYFLPYLMGERSPINDTNATGMYIGLRANTKRQDMLLATLEGVAFAIRDNLEIAKQSGVDIQSSTICGGGAKSGLWLKILANVLNIELLLPKSEEGPAYGAGILSMIACGGCDRTFDMPEIEKVIQPEKQLVEKYENRYHSFRKLYPSVKNLYKEIQGESCYE